MYLHMEVMPKLNKLIIVKPVLEFILYPLMNIYTLVMAKIIPSRSDLYMNNIIICEKK